jgi:hypothetical protein
MGKITKLAVVLILFLCVAAGNSNAQTWDALGLQGIRVADIALHSSAPDSVFAAAEDTIFKSTDGGATFTPVYTHPVAGRGFIAVQVAPTDPKTIIAADEHFSGKFFMSSDGGRNWVAPDPLPSIINGLSINSEDDGIAYFATGAGLYELRTLLDSLPSQAVISDPTDGEIIYTGLLQGNGVGKSTDGGATWNYYTTGFESVASFAVLDVIVNPLDNQNLFATGRWFTAGSALPFVFEMYRSSNGGESWVPMGWDTTEPYDLEIDPTQGYIFISHRMGFKIHPLTGGSFLDLYGNLTAITPNGIAISEGEKVLLATEDGVFGLDYLPVLEAGVKNVAEIFGNNNGIPEPGESIALSVGLVNSLFDGSDISATLSVINDPTVTVTDGTADYPDIPANSGRDNSADPFTLEIDASADTHFVDLQIVVETNGGAYTVTDTVSLMIGAPTVLVVDDDGGAAFDTFYTNTLDSMGVAFDSWDMSVMGPITDQLVYPSFYQAVIWMSGNETNNILTTEDLAVLTTYMGTGGRLILSGQNIVQDLYNGGSPDAFLTEVLHITMQDSNATGRMLFGVDGDLLGDQLERALISGGNGANNQTSPDIIALQPDSLARPWLTYVTPFGATAGVWMEEIGPSFSYLSRVVVLGFGFEAVNRTNPTDTLTVTRGEMMDIMLGFLEPGVGIGDGGPVGEVGMPKAFALGQNYPNPFNPSTTIEFTVPDNQPGAENVLLKIYNLRGQLVKTIVDDNMESGRYVVRWDGRSSNGAAVSSGIYIYRITVGDHVAARKMVLLK